MSKDITLGILYSGQLETQLVKSAKKIGGIKTVVLTDDKNGPAQHFCDKFVYADLSNKKVIEKFKIHPSLSKPRVEYVSIDQDGDGNVDKDEFSTHFNNSIRALLNPETIKKEIEQKIESFCEEALIEMSNKLF